MFTFGKHSEPAAPPPDPEGTIRIGGIRVTVESLQPGEVQVTFHGQRIHHHALHAVITSQLSKKGYDASVMYDNTANGAATTTAFAEHPTHTRIFARTADHTPLLTAEAITAECRELSAAIQDIAALRQAFIKRPDDKRPHRNGNNGRT